MDAYTARVRSRLASVVISALMLAAVVLVAWPVISGFASDSSQGAATTSTTARWCGTVLTHMDNVRRLPRPELQRVVVACNLTYTKDCGGSGDIDPHTGATLHSSYSCVIRDKHGKVVRTYTTDALRPTP